MRRSIGAGRKCTLGASVRDFVLLRILSAKSNPCHPNRTIPPQCTAADPASLLLLSDLAERSPLTLWSAGGSNGENLANLFQGVLSTLRQQSGAGSAPTAAQIEATLEAAVQVASASELAAEAGPGGDPHDLSRTIRSQTGEQSGGGGGRRVSPSSPASHLGRAALPPLLDLVSAGLSADPDAQRRCMEKLSHAAAHCPSLLSGDMGTLTGVVESCLGCAHSGAAAAAAAPLWAQDARAAALASLEALSSLVSVPDVRKKIVVASKLASAAGGADPLRLLLLGPDGTGGVVRLCAELVAGGVDGDVEAWASDAPNLQSNPATSWEDDDSAVYAESLLESFLRNLGGGSSTLPVVLPLVEALMNSGGWRNERAALSILERCLDAAPVTFAQHVPVAVEAALGLASTSLSVRVQLQALQLLGALCHADNAAQDGTQAAQQPAHAAPINVRGPYGGRILQVASGLVSSPCGKVSSHACLALVSYCRGGSGRDNCGAPVPRELLVPYLNDVLLALASGPLAIDVSDPAKVDAGGVAVLVRAINAVACLSDAAGEEFAPFYGSVMPGLLGCAQFGLQIDAAGGVRAASSTGGSSAAHDLATLRGSATEAATIVGEAVENEGLFAPDAEKIAGIVLPVLNGAEGGAAIIPTDQLLAASARIASVMGERYAHFMPSVLPHLLHRVREKPDVSFVDGDDSGLEATKRDGAEIDEERGTESITVALPGVGLKKLILNTTQMQEKAQACRAIYAHAQALGECFGQFSAECVEALLPLVNDKYSPDVRSTSAQALGPVFDAACAGTVAANSSPDFPMKAMQSITNAIIKQLEDEDKDDAETVFSLADALSEIFYSAYTHTSELDGRRIAQLSTDNARVTVKQLVEITKSCLHRRTEIIRSISGQDGNVPNEDESAELYEQLDDEGRQLTPLVDSIGYALKSLGQAFVPVFKAVVAPFFTPFLTSSGTVDVRARCSAVCLFDDCVEHCGSDAAARYAPYLAEAVLEGIDDSRNDGDEDLKSASVYGIAQIARHAPNNVLDGSINNIMGHLMAIIKTSEGKCKEEVEDLRLVENATSAVVSLAICDSSPYSKAFAAQRGALINSFLSNLPLREDPDEAQICHESLCDLIESGAVNISSDAAPLVSIIGQILHHVEDGEEIATPGTCARLGGILNHMQQQSTGDAIQKAFLALSPEAQAASNAAMKHAATYGTKGSSPACVTKLY